MTGRGGSWVGAVVAAAVGIGLGFGVRARADDGPPAGVARGDSGQFSGGPERRGDFPKAKLPGDPGELWRVESNRGYGDAVVFKGVVYAGSRGGTLAAFKAEDAALVWRSDDPARDIGKAPAVDGDRLLVSTSRGLAAFALADGKPLWNVPMEEGCLESSPVVAGGKVVVAGYDGFVRAVDAATGREVWKHDLAADAPESPPGFDRRRAVVGENRARPRTAACDGKTVFVPVFDQSRVVAVSLDKGERVWSFQAKGWVYPTPALSDDAVFVGSQDTHLYCLDKATGKERWKFKTSSRVEAGAAYRDGKVYFGGADGIFHCVDASNGKSVWSFETPKVPPPDAAQPARAAGAGVAVAKAAQPAPAAAAPQGASAPIYSAALLAGDRVCFGSFDGNVYALEVATGKKAWAFKSEAAAEVDTTPCTDGTRLFVGVRPKLGVGHNALVAVGPAE